MKIIIENKVVQRKGRKGFFAYTESGQIKTGYLVYDEEGNNIGIVFRSDDIRKKSYGQSEILFDENFEKRHKRTYYIIKINKRYLPFEELKKVMSKNERFEVVIDLKI